MNEYPRKKREEFRKNRYAKMTNQEVLDGFNRYDNDLLQQLGHKKSEICMKVNSLVSFHKECNKRCIVVIPAIGISHKPVPDTILDTELKKVTFDIKSAESIIAKHLVNNSDFYTTLRQQLNKRIYLWNILFIIIGMLLMYIGLNT